MSAICQLSSSSSIHRRFHLHARSHPSSLRSRVQVFMSHDRCGIEASSSKSKTILRYRASASKSQNEVPEKQYSNTEEYINGGDTSIGGDVGVPIQEIVTEQKRGAKIHDFCFGIPFGGLVLSGGLAGFIFSRNPATLITGVLSGGALLALSMFSLKVWRQGKSSLPFILGQAVLAAILLWKNIQTYSLKKKIFPTGFYAAVSAAMLCFYTYVVISGGNPPPKKKQSSAAAAAAASS